MAEATPSKTIVVEIGSLYTKIGFSGEAAPRHIVAKHMKQLMAPLRSDVPRAVVPRSVQEWKPLLRQLLDETMFGMLLCNPKDRWVVVVEDLLAPKNMRQALAECLFDMQVQSLVFAPGALLSLLPSGSRTGLVCDLGAEEARVLPVFDGVPIVSAYTTSQLGRGGDAGLALALHSAIRDELDAKDKKRSMTWPPATMEDLVARACVVPPEHKAKAAKLQAELDGASSAPEEFRQWLGRRLALSQKLAERSGPDDPGDYQLPGGVRVPSAARIAPATVFFGGDEEGDTVASLMVGAVSKCPSDVRRAVLQNVVLVGGFASLAGIAGRLSNELDDALAVSPVLSSLRPEVRVARPSLCRPNTTGWVGGSIVGSCVDQTKKALRDLRAERRGGIAALSKRLAVQSISREQFLRSRELRKLRSEGQVMGLKYEELARISGDLGLEVDASADRDDAADVMRAQLIERFREPEGQLPDWMRLTPGSVASSTWFLSKKEQWRAPTDDDEPEPLGARLGPTLQAMGEAMDGAKVGGDLEHKPWDVRGVPFLQSGARVWDKREGTVLCPDPSGPLSGSWQREMDAKQSSVQAAAWSPLPENVCAQLEAALRGGEASVEVLVEPAGTAGTRDTVAGSSSAVSGRGYEYSVDLENMVATRRGGGGLDGGAEGVRELRRMGGHAGTVRSSHGLGGAAAFPPQASA
jgi:actin-related protein 10